MKAPSTLRLTDTERLAWLRLIRSENVGPRTFWALMEHYGSAEQVIAVLPDHQCGRAHRCDGGARTSGRR